MARTTSPLRSAWSPRVIPQPGQSRPVVALKAQAGNKWVLFGSITPTATHPASAMPPAIAMPGLMRRVRVGFASTEELASSGESTGFVSTSASVEPTSSRAAVVAYGEGMNLGRVGLWAYQLDLVPSSLAQETAAEIDELGYGALWIPEMIGRESFVSSTLLLAASKKMVVATGIASIYARDALCANSAWNTVSEAFPDRFLLGLGVSHEVMVSGLRGHDYSKPYSAMKSYLDGMDNGLFTAAPPSAPPQKVLAALGPKMLELA
ncbi:MAG: LLM class flavin-dependent oxidoreductase, partial [Actinobacteria bacterium]|nr:LLM class flavin-dependent oxidoreductase [Actinomycetota bacterium]